MIDPLEAAWEDAPVRHAESPREVERQRMAALRVRARELGYTGPLKAVNKALVRGLEALVQTSAENAPAARAGPLPGIPGGGQ